MTPDKTMPDATTPGATTPPDEVAAAPLTAAVDALAHWLAARADQPVRLADMAAYTGYSAAHLQRAFTARLGLSPRAFHAACRERVLREALRTAASVTEALQMAGFTSTSRVYAGPAQKLGMSPSAYRAGGTGQAISYALADAPVQPATMGRLLLAATDRGLCAVQFGDDDAALLASLHDEFPDAQITAMPAGTTGAFDDWMQTLLAHLEGARLPDDLPLDVRGTAFQWQVWRYLQSIPRGEVRAYADVARAIGRPAAVRAVGSACGANRLAVVIPCHRVLRGDGALGGYRWGVHRKQALLDTERDAAS